MNRLSTWLLIAALSLLVAIKAEGARLCHWAERQVH